MPRSLAQNVVRQGGPILRLQAIFSLGQAILRQQKLSLRLLTYEADELTPDVPWNHTWIVQNTRLEKIQFNLD